MDLILEPAQTAWKDSYEKLFYEIANSVDNACSDASVIWQRR